MKVRLLTALVALVASSACVSAFPASSLDTGRGAEALPRGATRVQIGGGGGAAPLSLAVGGGAGARVEHQFLDDLAVSADVGAGLQTLTYLPTVVPMGSYIGAQWNPFGIQWFALRMRVGGGVDTPILGVLNDAVSSGAGSSLEPYASVALQTVLSLRLADNLAAYVVPAFGFKQFLAQATADTAYGPVTSPRAFCAASSSCGVVDTLLFPGATGGLQADMSENLSFYVAGNLTAGVVIGRNVVAAGLEENLIYAISPSANLQTGLAFTF